LKVQFQAIGVGRVERRGDGSSDWVGYPAEATSHRPENFDFGQNFRLTVAFRLPPGGSTAKPQAAVICTERAERRRAMDMATMRSISE
jgi:hypothetical protein